MVERISNMLVVLKAAKLREGVRSGVEGRRPNSCRLEYLVEEFPSVLNNCNGGRG